jgi:RNA polymerase sigma-70 factor (ECF subfamily)
MRTATVTSAQDEGETRACECACGHQETISLGRQKIEPMMLQPSERDVMLAAVPRLRAFAISLSGKVDRADDLVQETLLRAIANINSFTPGTNMSAWLFAILRNLFRSEFRKRRREVEDADGKYSDSLESPPGQHSSVEFKELSDALAKLPFVQREALVLVGASGFSYEEAAAICGTAVGTIKSRVSRARWRLAELLVIDSAGKFGRGPHDPGSEKRSVAVRSRNQKFRFNPETAMSSFGRLRESDRRSPSQ